MAINTLDDLVAGIQPPVQFSKVGTTFRGAGIWQSTFYQSGLPGAAAAPSDGLAGAALTSYAGQIRFPSTVSGKVVRLAKWEAAHSSSIGYLALVDRLWHNSGFTVTSTSAQTINSVAWPARDTNGSTDGTGVMIGMEVSTALGSGASTLTVSYTNSTGTSGRTGTIGPITASSQIGTFYPMTLASGDVGVRSVQTITSSVSMTSGVVNFVAYRQIAGLPMGIANVAVDRDAIALGLPLAYDSSVPFILSLPTATTATNVDGTLVWAQG